VLDVRETEASTAEEVVKGHHLQFKCQIRGWKEETRRYTDTEKDTVRYIRANFTFTDAADAYLRGAIRSWALQATPWDNMGAMLPVKELIGLMSYNFDLIIPGADTIWTQTIERTDEDIADLLFASDPTTASHEAFVTLSAEIPSSRVASSDLDDPIALFQMAGLATSNGDARRSLAQRSFYANGVQLDEKSLLSAQKRVHDKYLLLRKGKKSYHLLEIFS